MVLTRAGEEYRLLLRELDALIQAGEGESAAADEIRDRMDEPYLQMHPAERILRRDPLCQPACVRGGRER